MSILEVYLQIFDTIKLLNTMDFKMTNTTFPPYINNGDKVILFDGVCKLCNGWAKFIIKYDKQHLFKLASVQSEQGQALLKFFEMPTNQFDTMLLIDNTNLYTKTTAFFNVIKRLPYRFRWVLVFVIIPTPVRNWLYDRIALNRYQLFGKHSHCQILQDNDKNRFLS